MIENQAKVEGAVVYWTARQTDLIKLRAAWDKLDQTAGRPGTYTRMLPTKREGVQLLRDALIAEFPRNGNPRLVRRLTGSSALAVVTEHRGNDTNSYDVIQTAKLERTGTITTEPLNPAVDLRYLQLADTLPGSKVGNVLIKAVRKLDGTTLRSTGGIYWIPPDGLETFRLLAEAVEGAGGSTIYVMSTQFDDKTAEAVKDGLAAEVKATADWIIAQLSEGNLGTKAIEGRRARAVKLLNKTRRYEAILGTVLTEVRATIDEIEVAAAAAELVVQAEGMTA